MVRKNGIVPTGLQDRGASPIVGIVLLFALVFLGAALVFISGSAMIDALESEADRERLSLCVDETDHRLGTVAGTGHEMPLDFSDPDCQSDLVEDGVIEVVWYNDSPDWDDNVSTELNALEFDSNGQTIAHQGGGIWEATDDGVRVISDSGIQYDNETLQFNLMALEQDTESDGSGTPIARADHSRASAFSDEVMAEAGDYGNLAFRIDSSYHEGWNQSLHETLGSGTNPGVTIDHQPNAGENGLVEVTIEDVVDVPNDAELLIEKDLGLKNGIGGQQRIANGTPIQFEATLNNTGDSGPATHPTMTVSIDGGAIEEDGGGAVPENQTKDRHVSVDDYADDLTAGESYEYMISTKDGDELDTPGSFYLGEPGTKFTVEDLETTETSDTATVEAEIKNRGVQNGTETVSLEVDSINGTANQSVSLDYGSSTTVSWTLNRSVLPPVSTNVTVSTPETSANGTVTGSPMGVENTFVVEDRGVGDDQIVETETTATFESNVTSHYHTDGVTQDVELTIPDAGYADSQSLTLDSHEATDLEFDVDLDRGSFEPGTVYEYNYTTDGTGLSEPGRFYVGEPGAQFELSNPNASDAGDFVVLTADLENVGVEAGSQEVGFALEYLDPMPDGVDDGLYDDIPLEDNTVTRDPGEKGTIELPVNQTRLLDGPFEATIWTDDTDPVSTTFEVTAGVDPDTAGLGEIEDANVTVEVLGSQVSSQQGHLAPMTLDVVTNGETEHSFTNPIGGDNINIGSAWQNKDHPRYAYEFTVDEETELTLRNARYEICWDEETDGSDLEHYSGDETFYWCNDVPGSPVFGPIDASEDANLQNVRVRSTENNVIPALPAGTDHQLSATEVLEQRGLVEEGGDELDLDAGEFVFLFENTESTDEEGIDALWDEAIEAYEHSPDETYDPNFNDLIVYVQVERADVDPGTPSITISPGGGETDDLEPGSGSGGESVPGETDLVLDDGSGAVEGPDLGPGTPSGVDDGVSRPSGIDFDSAHIVIG